MNQPASNPILRRLQILEGLWNEFAADADARILRWIASDDSVQMLQTFIDLQSESSEIPDLFIELKSPLLKPAEWTSQLLAEFTQTVADNRANIEALGIVVRWNPPPPQPPPDHPTLLNSLIEFATFTQSLADHFVVVLNPSAVISRSELDNWLTKLATLPIPEALRFMVIDYDHPPQLRRLAESPVGRSVDPQLNMSQAYEQIAAEAGPPGPGHDFRRYYVATTNAAGQGDTAAASQAAAKAIEIAVRENWHHLACTVQMALGAAWFTAGKPTEFLNCCHAALKHLLGQTDDVCRKLLVTVHMSTGSACIAAGKTADAATPFQAAATAAAEIQDHRGELEGWRMAAWCLEQAGQSQPAWDCSLKSLAAAKLLDPEQRRNTHLPWAGETMLRLARKDKQRRDLTENQMTELLGQDWKSLLTPGAV